LAWLLDAIESNRHVVSSPISLDFAKLWYRDKLTPMVGAVAALGQVLRRHSPQTVLPVKMH
jgi:hypothetical protein